MNWRICLLLWVVLAPVAAAQDTPLSQVLAPNEWWHVRLAGGVPLVLASGANGSIFAGNTVTGRVTWLEPDDPLTTHAREGGLKSVATLPGRAFLVSRGEKPALIKVTASGDEFVVVDGFAPDALIVAPSGRIYATIAGESAIYVIESNGKKRRFACQIARPTCLALWLDGSTVVVGDGAGKNLWAFRIEADGSLAAGERYYTMRTRPGEASEVSSLAIDVKGRLFAATREGIQVFDPTGRLSGIITVPGQTRVQTIAIGGPNGDRFYAVTDKFVYYRKLITRGAAGTVGNP